ncbi:MAG: FtsW/RodA/SpoVE family cell cycle protein [Verrucomicrobiota bacterium]|nr:FtsW/RodA/SpoVE family cell cycle protein [Verrucomicrobiota bacterium]
MLISIAALLLIGSVFIYGISQQYGGRFSGYWVRHLLWCVGGVGIALFFAALDYHYLGKMSWYIYALSIFLLFLVLFIGREINNSKSWLAMPGFTIQPAEFAKPALLISISWYLSRPWIRVDKIKDLFPVFILITIPVALILLQPDLGSAFVLIPMAMAVLFVAGIPTRWMIYAAIAAILCIWPLYNYALKDYQKKRIQILFNPSNDISHSGWNARQSLLAVGSGGSRGKGFMKGTQNVLGFLPRTVAPTDFIFSVIAEEAGFFGGSLVIGFFLFLFLLSIRIAAKARDRFGLYLSVGFCMLMLTHCYINIGMTMGVAPIIGLPLPFVSYGGSFMLTCMIYAGIMQSIYIFRKEELKL